MDTVLFCDSNCEIWYDLAEHYKLNVIYMPYSIDGNESFYDLGRNTDFKEFYAKIRKGSIPLTSALNEYNYTEYFEPFLKEGKDILYISFSHKLSATFESMNKAIAALKEKYPKNEIVCIDSKNISMGAGAVVLEAAKYFAQGGVIKADLIKKIEQLKSNVRTLFAVDDLHHLKRGGRISGAAAVFGSLLGIKPLLKITQEGKIENFAKAKGRKKSMLMLLDNAEKAGIDTTQPVYMVDADAPDAPVFAQLFSERFTNAAQVYRQPVGPVIGTHCGPGTLGLIFFTKEVSAHE
ncbi:MAG: DegV family protein [Firmicutes bacterium]|nr:DegV family protein [Bacillota bacterium]